MKPVIKETVIRQIELDNLNYQIEFDFFGKHPDDDCWDYEWLEDYDGGIGNNSVYWKDNEHVPVDMLLETVEKLKAEGATHVQIYPHGDHQSYYITGVKLELMPEKDVLEKEKEKLEVAIKNQEQNVETQRDKVTESVDFLGELYEKLETLNNEEIT